MSTCAHCRYEELSSVTRTQLERAAALAASARVQQAMDPSGRAAEVLVGANRAFTQLTHVMKQLAMAKELGLYPDVCTVAGQQANA